MLAIQSKVFDQFLKNCPQVVDIGWMARQLLFYVPERQKKIQYEVEILSQGESLLKMWEESSLLLTTEFYTMSEEERSNPKSENYFFRSGAGRI